MRRADTDNRELCDDDERGRRQASLRQGATSCGGQLLYNGFSLVWFDVFDLSSPHLPRETDGFIFPIENENLDSEIFDDHFLQRAVMDRFRLDSFKISVTVDTNEQSPQISGEVHVRATKYFDETVCVSYRLIASTDLKDAARSGYCQVSEPLTTDHLILLAGMGSVVENWHSTSTIAGTEDFAINRPVFRCVASEVRIDEHGKRVRGAGGAWVAGHELIGRSDVFQDVMARYRRYLTGSTTTTSTGYCLIDVWESIDHSGPESFRHVESAAIVRHIDEHHRSELIGLLTLYPYEWPYRDPRFYLRVCGPNIAIDTDDLVLVAHNVALVLGTYGRRGQGSPTPWAEILAATRRTHHVSWGEYLRILEIVVAKLHTINSARGRLPSVPVSGPLLLQVEKRIRENSRLALSVSRMIVDMNAVTFSRYPSHKMMYEQTEQRLGVERDLEILTMSLAQIDKAIHNLDSIAQAQRSRFLNGIVLAISVASLFQLIYQPVSIPLLQEMIDETVAKTVGSAIISIVAAALVLLPAILLTSVIVQYLTRYHRRSLEERDRRFSRR